MTVIAVAVVLLGAFCGQAVGFIVGNRLRPARHDRSLTRADAVLGLGAGVVGALLLAWLLVPVLGQRPGPIAQEVSASWVARQLDERLPAPPDALQALRSFVGEDNFPDVFADLAPTPALGPPPAATGLSQETAEQVARSVVRVEGVACRRIQDGTGFVVEPGLVATNAHVVAGESVTELIRDDGTRVDATVVVFDPDRDLALLEAPGLDRPPLPVAVARPGDVGGVFGHPRGEPLRVAPFAVARLLDATGRNIYGSQLVEREVLEVAADLAPGDSGSPLVNAEGEVVGVTFAIARDRPSVAYALQTTELDEALRLPRVSAGTGPCVTG
jgi:S1-C subfamily serine protease